MHTLEMIGLFVKRMFEMMLFFFLLWQKQCIDFAVNARPTSRYMPKNKKTIKYKIWKLVVSTKFEYFVMTLIALNTIVLMMKVCIYIASQYCNGIVMFFLFLRLYLWLYSLLCWSEREIYMTWYLIY